VVVIGGAEGKVGGKGEVVHPVSMRRECMEAVPGSGVPDLDGLVLRRSEDAVEAAPAHTGYRAFVPRQCLFYPSQGDIPYSNCAIF